MSLKDDLYAKLDTDDDGKVTIHDAVTAIEDRLGVTQTRWGFGGFVAGVIVTAMALWK